MMIGMLRMCGSECFFILLSTSKPRSNLGKIEIKKHNQAIWCIYVIIL